MIKKPAIFKGNHDPYQEKWMGSIVNVMTFCRKMGETIKYLKIKFAENVTGSPQNPKHHLIFIGKIRPLQYITQPLKDGAPYNPGL